VAIVKSLVFRGFRVWPFFGVSGGVYRGTAGCGRILRKGIAEVAAGIYHWGMDDTTGFGERLRALREAKGWTQGQLAQRAGLRMNSVSRLELGKYPPTWPTVLALAAALGLESLDELRPQAGAAGAVPGAAGGRRAGGPATPKARARKGGAR
jgi:DNA-binding XRE family transcriptional regulator